MGDHIHIENDRGPWLTKSRVAERFQTTTRSIERWTGDLSLEFPQPLIVKGYWYFSLPELVAWENTHKSAAARDYSKMRKRAAAEATA